MKAAWYEKQGVARDVLIVGEIDAPQPHSDGAGTVDAVGEGVA
jgi:NADPH:quinone reductase-like Zn-dependent oxidoreductase